MDWAGEYEATFYGEFLNPDNWITQGRFEVIDGSITRDESNLRQSAELTCTDYDQTQERWIRIYMDVDQNGQRAHEPLFTGIATSPERKIDGAVVQRQLECYSVLKPCEDVLLPRGWFVPAGTNGANAIRKLLTVTKAPVFVNGTSPNLLESIVADEDETNLTMIDLILDAIGWRLQIEGDGTIVLSPFSMEPVTRFSARERDILQTSLSIERDWFNCPNVVRVTSGNLIAIARDEDPDSPLSVSARGREIWLGEDDVDLSDQESIGQYAERLLAEEQEVGETASYTRCYLPEVNVGDVVTLNYDEIQGDYVVSSQDISLTYGGETSEEVKWLRH